MRKTAVNLSLAFCFYLAIFLPPTVFGKGLIFVVFHTPPGRRTNQMEWILQVHMDVGGRGGTLMLLLVGVRKVLFFKRQFHLAIFLPGTVCFLV